MILNYWSHQLLIAMHSLSLLVMIVFLVPFATSQPQVTLEPAFENLVFSRPVDLQHFSDHLYVVEQQGRIWTFENRQTVQERHLFLDITDRVRTENNEEGLLGLTFHPDHNTNGYLFVYYTASGPRRSVVSRFNVFPNQPNRADPDSEVTILQVDQPAGNHNGGQIAFGPDGYLYIALGDGGGAGDTFDHGQNTKSLLGTISRIDVSTIPYSIPPDNPFANSQIDRPEIFAWGLRNPWRFSFDIKTGTLFNADVGQNKIEEVNIIEKGNNYGWPIMEGTQCFRPPTNCNRTGLALPIFEYDHSNGPASVTGGYVYQGTGVPDLTGWYIFGDYVDGRFWGLRHDGVQLLESYLLEDSFLSPLSFGIDHQGEVYVLSIDGRIYWFSATGGTLGFESRIEPLQFIRNVPIPETILPSARGGTGNFTYSISPALPSGLSFEPSTRSLQGTPLAILNTTKFMLQAEDDRGLRGDLEFELSILESLHYTAESEPLPRFVLHGHYPNPSSGDTRIVFDLATPSVITVEIHNLLGRRIKTLSPRTMTASAAQSIRIPTSTLPSGSYVYRITVESEDQVITTSRMFFIH